MLAISNQGNTNLTTMKLYKLTLIRMVTKKNNYGHRYGDI